MVGEGICMPLAAVNVNLEKRHECESDSDAPAMSQARPSQLGSWVPRWTWLVRLFWTPVGVRPTSRRHSRIEDNIPCTENPTMEANK